MIDDLRNGDPETVEQMVKSELPAIFRLCNRLCRTEQDAEDLCQDVFVRAVRALGSFKGDSAISTWLYRIALNAWKNRLRSDQVRQSSHHVSLTPAPTDESMEMQIAENLPGPDQQAEQKDNRSQIIRALDRLDADHRTILVLRDMEERTYEEIVQILDLSLGTVKSRISRARLALREEILKIHGASHL